MQDAVAMTQFADFLAMDCLLASQLYDILEQEYQALSGVSIEALSGIAEQKKEIVDRLEASTAQRIELLKSLHRKNTTPDIEALIAHAPQVLHERLSSLWMELTKTLAACHRQNQVNGKVVSISMRSTRQLLGILHGKTTHQLVYNNEGQMR